MLWCFSQEKCKYYIHTVCVVVGNLWTVWNPLMDPRVSSMLYYFLFLGNSILIDFCKWNIFCICPPSIPFLVLVYLWSTLQFKNMHIKLIKSTMYFVSIIMNIFTQGSFDKMYLLSTYFLPTQTMLLNFKNIVLMFLWCTTMHK